MCIWDGTRGVDKAPRLSTSIVIWVLSSDTICQLNQLNTNSDAAMLSTVVVCFVYCEQVVYSRWLMTSKSDVKPLTTRSPSWGGRVTCRWENELDPKDRLVGHEAEARPGYRGPHLVVCPRSDKKSGTIQRVIKRRCQQVSESQETPENSLWKGDKSQTQNQRQEDTSEK